MANGVLDNNDSCPLSPCLRAITPCPMKWRSHIPRSCFGGGETTEGRDYCCGCCRSSLGRLLGRLALACAVRYGFPLVNEMGTFEVMLAIQWAWLYSISNCISVVDPGAGSLQKTSQEPPAPLLPGSEHFPGFAEMLFPLTRTAACPQRAEPVG